MSDLFLFIPDGLLFNDRLRRAKAIAVFDDTVKIPTEEQIKVMIKLIKRKGGYCK